MKTMEGTTKKGFYKELLALALPIALQNLVFTLLNMTDNLMIGQFGEIGIAGVGAANRVFFLLNLLMFGINSGAVIFTSQFWGVKDIKSIKKVLGFAVVLTVLGAIPFSIGAIFFPEKIIYIFNQDPEVIKQGAAYLRIMGLSYVITGISYSFMFELRAIGKPTIPMVTSLITVGLNVSLNAILIFGLFGFPALGVRGAAIATVTSRVVEMIILLSIVFLRKLPLAGHFKEYFDWDKALIKKMIIKMLPVVANEVFWSIGVTIYAVIYGNMGTNQLAAITILGTIEQLGMVLFFGMGNACAVMLGSAMGSNQLEKAWFYGKRFAVLSFVAPIFMSVALYGFAPLYLKLFNVNPEVVALAKSCLLIYVIVMPLKVFNTINIIGFLRSGGDTVFALLLDVLGVWVVAVPLGFLGYYLGLPLQYVYLLVMCEEVFKVILGIPRFLSKKWINNLVQE